MSDNAPSTAKTLAELTQRRVAAQAKVDELERQQRAASGAVAQASATLADLERRALGGEKVSAATRRQAEDALHRARSEAEQPWPSESLAAALPSVTPRPRCRGSRPSTLTSWSPTWRPRARPAAAKLTAAAETLMQAFTEREQIAREIAETCSLAGARIAPGDVSYSRAGPLARAAGDLLQAGGEDPPRLRRDPREPRHGRVTPSEAASAA